MRNLDEENGDKKPERRQKVKKPYIKKNMLDDELINKNNAKKEIKKLKESFDDEEWENWDRFYNH
jgi:hypothetical protein